MKRERERLSVKDRERGRHEPNCDRGESKWIDGYASPFIFLAGPTQHPHTPRARSTRQIGVILFLAPRSVTSSRAFAYSHYRASAVRSNAVMPVSALRSVWVANSTSRECLSLSLSLSLSLLRTMVVIQILSVVGAMVPAVLCKVGGWPHSLVFRFASSDQVWNLSSFS